MNGFLTDLSTYQKVFFVISASSTIILIIQTIFALIGLANNDTEIGDTHIVGADTDGDGEIDVYGIDANGDGIIDTPIDSVDSGMDVHLDHVDHDHSSVDADNISDHSNAQHFDTYGLRLFTVRGIMAFLMMGSWVGFLLSRAGIHEVIATVCAFVSGVIALIFMAKLMQILMGLQEDGTIKVKNTLGQIGQVYIRIPGEEKGKGKVNVTIQEKLCEFDAVTEKSETIKTGEMVYITDVRAGNVLVVEKVEEKE